MKQFKAKKPRSSWLYFAITGIVLVVLSISVSQMLPKSHPLRALRKLDGGADSASKSIEVQGAPLAVAGAISDDANSDNETNPKPENQTNATPSPASVSPIPKIGSEKSAKRTGEYQSLTFETLSSFDIREPDWDKLEDPAYIAALNLDEDIPPKIKALSGEKIEVEGFMLPLVGEDDNLESFVLLENQLACCFGAIPLLNEWIYVRVPKRKRIRSHQDELIMLYGTLRVGAEFEDGMLNGIYHLELDRLETVALKLGRF
ncbi:MAG: DUF3299 domain-containing protein [Candidatus Poribacteria bacterium]|nr:DUF3299 domain-containing protein [Candidatus Poribacteria bacterium]